MTKDTVAQILNGKAIDEAYPITITAGSVAALIRCLADAGEQLKEGARNFDHEGTAGIRISMGDALEMKNISYASGYLAALENLKQQMKGILNGQIAS